MCPITAALGQRAPIPISSRGLRALCAAPWRTRLSLAPMAASVPKTSNIADMEQADGRAAQYPVQLHSLDPGGAYHRGDRLDVGHALSAAPVCLSHRNQAGLGIQRAFQGDGTPAAQGDHESLHDRGVDSGPAAG